MWARPQVAPQSLHVAEERKGNTPGLTEAAAQGREELLFHKGDGNLPARHGGNGQPPFGAERWVLPPRTRLVHPQDWAKAPMDCLQVCVSHCNQGFSSDSRKCKVFRLMRIMADSAILRASPLRCHAAHPQRNTTTTSMRNLCPRFWNTTPVLKTKAWATPQ